jgi:hypothetical protein
MSIQNDEDKSVSKAPQGIQASSCAVSIARILVFPCSSQKFPNSAICCRRRFSDAPPFSLRFLVCMFSVRAARLNSRDDRLLLLQPGRVSGYDVMTYDWMMLLALAVGCTALTRAGLQ